MNTDIWTFFCFSDVIHTVGPIARGNVGQVQREDLASCYKSSLKLVEEYSLRSVVSALRSQTFIRLCSIYEQEMKREWLTDWVCRLGTLVMMCGDVWAVV